ncbi:GNAT family N-acetyltransferase [Jatrophihabitans sp.]|uniref:GNAT family N-acetyltransferase n=1 Tax=Jatrophihabitans sp. TaxID=1932789 RepID=UPI0030C7298D|nr:Acetyltransferase, family [Jatrophihabitans sp.]
MPAVGSLALAEAGPLDEPFLAELFLAVRPFLALTGLDQPQLEGLVGMQRRAQRSGYERQWPGYRQLVARVDGEPVATIARADAPDLVHILDIAVLPTAQGRGIGTALLTAVLDEAGTAVQLSVAPDNPARRLYERLGFVVVGSGNADLLMLWRGRAR